MRTFTPMFGGMMLGTGLYRVWLCDYKNASFYLTASAIIYFIGYVIERYKAEEHN